MPTSDRNWLWGSTPIMSSFQLSNMATQAEVGHHIRGDWGGGQELQCLYQTETKDVGAFGDRCTFSQTSQWQHGNSGRIVPSQQFIFWKFCISNHKFHSLSHFLCPPPPLKKERHIAKKHMSVGWSVCMSVSHNLVQLITQECFALQASNLVGR